RSRTILGSREAAPDPAATRAGSVAGRLDHEHEGDVPMTKRDVAAGCLLLALAAPSTGVAPACTSIVVSGGASRDRSNLITYSADAPFMPRLLRVPGGDHPAGTMVNVRGWENDQVRGQVKEAPRTYSVVALMNEHQLAMGETTTGGRRELVDRKGLLDYDALLMLTLQRAKPAREARRLIAQVDPARR